MSDFFDSEEEIMIRNQAERLFDYLQKMEKKRKRKLKNVAELPFPLVQGLNYLTREELHEIRGRIGVGNATLKKADLIVLLEKEIPQRLETLLSYFDDDRYRILKSAQKNGGMIPLEILTVGHAEWFPSSGLLFLAMYQEQETMIIPREIMDAFSKIDEISIKKKIARNKMLVDLTRGMLHYYGVFDYYAAPIRLEKVLKEKIDFRHYDTLIEDAMTLTNNPGENPYGYHDFRVVDYEGLLAQHMSRPDIPYHDFTKKELLEAANGDKYERNHYTKEFSDFLNTTFEVNQADINDLLDHIQEMVLVGETFSDVMVFLSEITELPDEELLNMIAGYIQNIYNNSRTWTLKGNTPLELREAHDKKNIPLRHKEPDLEPLITKAEQKSNVVNITTARKPGKNK